MVNGINCETHCHIAISMTKFHLLPFPHCFLLNFILFYWGAELGGNGGMMRKTLRINKKKAKKKKETNSFHYKSFILEGISLSKIGILYYKEDCYCLFLLFLHFCSLGECHLVPK